MPIRVHNVEQVRKAVLPRLAHVRELLALPLGRIEKLPRTRAAQHPLVRALEAAEHWVNRPDLATAPIEGYVVEAAGLGVLVDARGADPGLRELIAGMVDPDQYLHALGVLGVAHTLQEGLPRIEQLSLVRQDPTKSGPIPDLHLSFDGGHRLSVEAKAPRFLHWPRRPVTRRIARGCVRHAISEAAGRVKSQLPKDSPGLVALASFGVDDPGIELLRAEADSFLKNHSQNDEFLMGVLFVDFRRRGTLELAPNQPGPAGSFELAAGVFWSRHLRMAHNPGYRGKFKIGLQNGHSAAKEQLDFA